MTDGALCAPIVLRSRIYTVYALRRSHPSSAPPRANRPPTHRKWGIFLMMIGGATLAAFSYDFFLSRRAYGLFAAVHAWIEVPILLAALLGPAHSDSSLTPAAT